MPPFPYTPWLPVLITPYCSNLEIDPRTKGLQTFIIIRKPQYSCGLRRSDPNFGPTLVRPPCAVPSKKAHFIVVPVRSRKVCGKCSLARIIRLLTEGL